MNRNPNPNNAPNPENDQDRPNVAQNEANNAPQNPENANVPNPQPNVDAPQVDNPRNDARPNQLQQLLADQLENQEALERAAAIAGHQGIINPTVLGEDDAQWIPAKYTENGRTHWTVITEVPTVFDVEVVQDPSIPQYSQDVDLVANRLAQFTAGDGTVASNNSPISTIHRSVAIFSRGLIELKTKFNLKGFGGATINLMEIENKIIQNAATYGTTVSDDRFRRDVLSTLLFNWIKICALPNSLVKAPKKFLLSPSAAEQPIFRDLLRNASLFETSVAHPIWACEINTIPWFRNDLIQMFTTFPVVLAENGPIDSFNGVKLRTEAVTLVDQAAAELINLMHEDYFNTPLTAIDWSGYLTNFTFQNERKILMDGQYDNGLRPRNTTPAERRLYLLQFYLDDQFRSASIGEVCERWASSGIFYSPGTGETINLMSTWTQNTTGLPAPFVNYLSSLQKLRIDMNRLTVLDSFAPFFEPTFTLGETDDHFAMMFQIVSILLTVNLFPQICTQGIGHIAYLLYARMKMLFPQDTREFIETYGWFVRRGAAGGWVQSANQNPTALTLTEMQRGTSLSLLQAPEINTALWGTIAQLIRPVVHQYHMPNKQAANLPFMSPNYTVTTSHEYHADPVLRDVNSVFRDRAIAILAFLRTMQARYVAARGVRSYPTSVKTVLENINSSLAGAAESSNLLSVLGIGLQQWFLGHELEYVCPNFNFNMNHGGPQEFASIIETVIGTRTTEMNPRVFIPNLERASISLDSGLAILMSQDVFVGRYTNHLPTRSTVLKAGVITTPGIQDSAVRMVRKIESGIHQMTSLMLLQSILTYQDADNPWNQYAESLQRILSVSTVTEIIKIIDEVRGTSVHNVIERLAKSQGLVDPRVVGLRISRRSYDREIRPADQPPNSYYNQPIFTLDNLTTMKGHLGARLIFNLQSSLYMVTQGVRFGVDKVINMNPHELPGAGYNLDWDNPIDGLPDMCGIVVLNDQTNLCIRLRRPNEDMELIVEPLDERLNGCVFRLDTLLQIPQKFIPFLTEALLMGRIGFIVNNVHIRYNIALILHRNVQVYSYERVAQLWQELLQTPSGGLIHWTFADTTQAVNGIFQMPVIHRYLNPLQPLAALPTDAILRGVTTTVDAPAGLYQPADPDNWSFGTIVGGRNQYPQGQGFKDDFSKINFNNAIKVVSSNIQPPPTFSIDAPQREYVQGVNYML